MARRAETQTAVCYRCADCVPYCSFIPIPGIDAAVLAKLLEQREAPSLKCLTCSLVVLSAVLYLCSGDHAVYFGIDHYPAAEVVHPTLAEIKKEGESGRRKTASTPATVLWCWQYSSRSVLYRSAEYAWYARPGH